MKIKFFLIQIILLLLFVPTMVFGVEGTGDSQNTGVATSQNNDYKWPASSIGITDDKSIRGVRITLYEFYNNVATPKKSIDFFNRNDFSNYLKNNSVNFYTNMTSRLTHKVNNDTSISYGIITNDNVVNSNLPLFLDKGVTSLSDFFNPNGSKFNKDTVLSFLDNFKNYKTNKFAQYYYVVEPTTFLIIAGYPFYGTAYEHAKFVQAKGVQDNAKKYLMSHIYHQLPMSFYVGVNSISTPDTANFNGFLNSFSVSKVPESFITGCAAKSEVLDCMTNDDVLSYTFGMGILWDGYFNKQKDETCTYTVNVNKCGNPGISEPNSEVCTIGKTGNAYGNPWSLYEENIYCSYSVSSNFTNFYNNFSSVKRVGSYFPMEDLTITADMLCYFEKTYDWWSDDWYIGWEEDLESREGGTISLNIGGRTYTLESSKTDNNPVCESSQSNGLCNKAKLTTTYTYRLNPLVNRFVSIETMKEDTEEEQTETNIDNGGPRLTIPLNYQTGTYKYTLDLNNSIFGFFKTRIANGTSNITKNNIRYILTYKTDKSLTDEDLKYICPYKTSRTPDTPVNECKAPDDKCCDELGNVINCPTNDCLTECCDENGEPTTCPGHDLGIAYRPISLTNPFPGIKGNGRLPNSNWNKIVTKNGTDYSATDYYIKYNRGYTDYELYREAEPLYVIKLDGDIIREIREYNAYKKHNYDNFGSGWWDHDFECLNGQKCISKFLRGQADGFWIDLIDSGTCKDITHDTFDSCVTRKGD